MIQVQRNDARGGRRLQRKGEAARASPCGLSDVFGCSVEDHVAVGRVGRPVDEARLGEEGFSPIWEWSDDHGSFFEVAVIYSDAGNFDAILIPKTGMPAVLLDLCAAYATTPA